MDGSDGGLGVGVRLGNEDEVSRSTVVIWRLIQGSHEVFSVVKEPPKEPAK